MEFTSVAEILEYAIRKEEEAATFYTDLASRVSQPSMQEVFLSFAGEEKEHRRKLLAVRSGNLTLLDEQKVVDLKIGDHLVDITLSPDLDYKQALIIAMKAEKEAFRLYQTLAAATDDADLKALLQLLAHEEARHKLRFEIEYDDYYLREN